MNPITSAYEQLIDRFVTWAQARPDIQAAIVLGSRARIDRPADEWSDLDIVILVTDPKPYLTNADWLKELGTVWITYLEPTATGGEWERRVLFEGGLDVDFSIIPTAKAEQMLQYGLPPDVAETFRRGQRVLLDRNGLAAQLNQLPLAATSSRQPASAEVLETINDFWYHTVWTAKKLRRGEVWTAKSCCDCYMKHLLLTALEWHAHALNDPAYDTWHRGRFLEQWADPRALQTLPEVFARYGAEDIARALVAMMDLFRWLTKETVEHLGYPYPTAADKHATELVDELLSGLARTEVRESA